MDKLQDKTRKNVRKMATARIGGTRKIRRPQKRRTEEFEEDLKVTGISNVRTVARE
jgi:hypothetical protein